MSWIDKFFITFFHKKVGDDELLNQYYESKTLDYLGRPKRFVIYKNADKSTEISPSWHAWLHHLVNEVPKNVKLFSWQENNKITRVLSKFAYREKFVGDTKRSTAAYKKVREDVSIGSTHKLPLEVEFGKNSTKKSSELSNSRYSRWQP